MDGEFPIDALIEIKAPSTLPSDVATDSSELEERTLNQEQEKFQSQVNKELLKELQSKNNFRDGLPDKILCVTISWLAAVLLIVLFSGFDKEAYPGFITLKYESSVLIALITSTTASVVGMFVIILQYLFPGQGNKSNP